MFLEFTVFITFIAAFLATKAILPFLIFRMKKRGIVGIDANKAGSPKIPEMGGIAVLLGFCFGVMASIFFFTYSGAIPMNLTLLLAALSTVIIVGFLGLVDDIIGWKDGIRQWQHALVPLFAALPLMAVSINNPPITVPFFGILPAEIVIPFIGVISFGVIYSLFLVPIGITGASNAYNMLAGLNGLEAGLGIITAFTLLLISYIDLGRGGGSIEAIFLLAAFIGALLAFYQLNKYPAKIFGGDGLTLMAGSVVASAAIIGNMEKVGILVMALFFIELYLKSRTKFQAESFGIIQADNTLKAPEKIGSLTHLFMKRGRFTEPQLVLQILGVQLLISIIVFLMFWFRVFNWL